MSRAHREILHLAPVACPRGRGPADREGRPLSAARRPADHRGDRDLVRMHTAQEDDIYEASRRERRSRQADACCRHERDRRGLYRDRVPGRGVAQIGVEDGSDHAGQRQSLRRPASAFRFRRPAGHPVASAAGREFPAHTNRRAKPRPRPAAARSTDPSHMMRSNHIRAKLILSRQRVATRDGNFPAATARDHAPVSLTFWDVALRRPSIEVAPMPINVRAASLV